MTAYIDYGNGYIAYARTTGDVRLRPGHSGLLFPTVEVPVAENAVMDGATIGTTRARGRRSVHPLYFRTATRAAIAAAFSPGVERTMTTAIGSMPYYVEDVVFVSANLKGPQDVRVVCVSPLAYPEGDTLTATFEGGTGGGWGAEEAVVSHTTTDGYDQLTFLGAGTYEVGKGTKFVTDASQRITGVKLWIASATARDEWLCEVRLNTDAVGYPSTEIASGQALISTTTALTEFLFKFDTPVELASGYGATMHVYSLDAITWWDELRFATDSGKGYAGGGAFTVASDGVDLTYVLDTAADLKFQVIGQNLDTGTGTVTFDADTDVPCAPKVTCVIVTGDNELVLTGTGWTTTITGPFVTGDIIVVDAREFTVTVNGTDALADFVRTGDWPEASPGSNTITIAPAAATTVQWKPRRLGLI